MSLEKRTGYPEMPKDSSECVKLLRQFNEWRRFDGEIDEEGPAMPHPKSIGFAIDMAIRLIEERGELLAALENVLVTRNAEAKASSAFNNAAENLSDDSAEETAYVKAMIAASKAGDSARATIATAKGGA